MRDMDRQQQIVEFLRIHPFASIHELQERLGVSAATARRDIDKLEKLGLARKVYGGVAAFDGAAQASAFARPYDQNRDLAVEAKRAIAELAAGMVSDGDTIIIHGGSTCFHLGARLANRSIHLFTNSMPLAAYVGDQGCCSLTVAGGDLHREPRIIYSTQQKPQFYASKFFLGAEGIGPDGILESHPLLVRSVQELSQNADQVVVLADSRKFSIRARNVSLPLSRVNTIVTDEGLSDAAASMLEKAGTDVRIALLSGRDEG